MLVLKPIKDTDELKKLLGVEDNTSFGYIALYNDNVIGKIAVYCKDASVFIGYLETNTDKDKPLADGLIRACLDKAASQNILYYNFSTDVWANWGELLSPMGYSFKEDYIYKFFTSTHKCTGCGNCGKNNE